MIRRLFVIGVLLIIVNWGNDVLRDIGIRHRRTAAEMIRDTDKGIGQRATSGVIVFESTPSAFYGSSDTATYYNPPSTYNPTPGGYVYPGGDSGTLWGTSVFDTAEMANAGSAETTYVVVRRDTTDSVRLPTTKKIVLPF